VQTLNSSLMSQHTGISQFRVPRAVETIRGYKPRKGRYEQRHGWLRRSHRGLFQPPASSPASIRFALIKGCVPVCRRGWARQWAWGRACPICRRCHTCQTCQICRRCRTCPLTRSQREQELRSRQLAAGESEECLVLPTLVGGWVQWLGSWGWERQVEVQVRMPCKALGVQASQEECPEEECQEAEAWGGCRVPCENSEARTFRIS